MQSLFALMAQCLLVPLISPLAIGVIRCIKARMQNRRGASIVQPYRDLWKLFHKSEVMSEDASWIFRITPMLLFALTLVISTGIPILTTVNLGWNGDFLFMLYCFAFMTFFLALAGMDTGGGFGGFGASREMLVASLTEGGLIFSLFTMAFLSHSSNLFEIAHAIPTLSSAHLVSIMLAGASFAIALLAETSRYPFDNPATHLELTMIHEAMILEYSGKRLALMEWAAANKLFIFLVLAGNIFFPWGIAQSTTLVALGISFLFLLLKSAVLCAGIALLESTMAKLRIFKLPDLLFTSFIMSVIALGLAL